VQDIRAALDDPHFQARGLFAHRLQNGAGGEMPALPVPIQDVFRAPPSEPAATPPLGAHNAEFGV
jgi:crotonobetainyl-CoA:carnitine CoA-transferase CaiB-like acyl-CoA transferase